MVAVSRIKIQKAMIYGFGKWIDHSIDFSNESFICVYGENESGKSTLQNFILFMLFGLPPKQRSFFRPKTSGKMGGKLTVSDNDIGEYIIERIDGVKNGQATCYLPGGEEHGEDWLKEHLRGMTRETYQSIFSFSAIDLNDFSTMKDEDLGEILLGIGLTGSNNIYEIEKRLDQKIGNLFKPTGKIPKINKQLGVLDDYHVQLTEVRNNEAMYHHKQEQVNTLLNEISVLQMELREAREKQLITEKNQRNIPVINDYHLYNEQLSKLPQTQPFPENGIERVNLLKEQLLPLKSEYAVLVANQIKYEESYEKTKAELLHVDAYRSGQVLLNKEQQLYQRKQTIANLTEDVQTLTIKIDTALQELNIGLTQEKLLQMSMPFFTETVWKELKEKSDQLQHSGSQLQRDHHALKKQKQYLTEQKEDIKAKLLTPRQQEQLNQRLESYRAFDYLNKIANESSEKEIKWQKIKQQKEKKIKSIFQGSLILGLAIGGAGLLFEHTFLYYIMIASLSVGFGQWVWGKKSIEETTRLLTNDETIKNPSDGITEAEKWEAEELLIKDDEKRSVLRSLKEQLKSIDIQYIQWTEKDHTWKQNKIKLQQEIDTQIDCYPFLHHIDPRHWADLFQTIKQLFEKTTEKQKTEKKAEKLTNTLKEYQHEVEEFLKGIYDDFIPETLELQVKKLKNVMDQHRDSNLLLAQYGENLDETADRKTDLKRKMAVYELEVEELFQIANVETEEEFYRMDKMNEKRASIVEKIEQASNQLQAVFSSEEWWKLRKIKPNESTLEMEYEQILGKCEQIEEMIHVKRQKLADLNAEIINMETSEVYSQTLHRFMMEKDELGYLAKEWAILKVAKEMLAETKRKYRNKYLTRVIHKTSTYFSELTAGNYIDVIPPIDGKPFQVETNDQMRYQVNELSQGTIDQLYVCLRLAISEIMSEKHALPFIIDDAFVHFDTKRTRRMMDILLQMASNRQVIVFTCREEVKKSLQNNGILYI